MILTLLLSSGGPVTQYPSAHGYMAPKGALGMVSNQKLSSDMRLPLTESSPRKPPTHTF